MRTLGAVLLAIALLAQVNVASAQTPAPVPAAAAEPAAAHRDWRPIAIGAGAIAGVVLFNVAALGIEALPGGLAYEAGDTIPAEMSVAMSRVYAATAAVAGGLLAYYALGR
jgi:hypothetical protein